MGFFLANRASHDTVSSYPRDVVKFKVKKMAKSLLKHHCYCQMLLMRTTKTAVCLQRPFFITFMDFNWCSSSISCEIFYQ